MLNRFFSHTKTLDNGCIIWKSSTVPGGYGAYMAKCSNGKYKTVRAHRYIYEQQVGPISKGLLVCHKCDNRLCVNIHHLFLGSHKDNTKDMLSKGRQHSIINMEIAEKIRVIYLKGALTQKEVGDMFGVSQSSVHAICTNKQWRRYVE